MNLFADYIQPLTNWLQANPSWALFITFFISLTESLAIIGSIVPGSVTMTAIGILAGSGIMRIDLTLLAATLGAISGDSLSYALGYYYSERLVDIWPFRKYPLWLKYGKDFFARHGGKSVLIGRFVGPLRSIIPVIAGIMHMKQWRFLIANIISAIGWSLLYVMPGVLIGAASHELSAESATRFFILILVLLAGMWVTGVAIHWILTSLNSFLRKNLHNSWLKLKKHRQLCKLYYALTPTDEDNHYPTAALFLSVIFSIVCLIALIIMNAQTDWLSNIALPLNLLLQSFHTPLLEAFFIFCTQVTSTLTLSCVFGICCLWFIDHKSARTILYLLSTLLISTLLALLLAHYINSPRPQGLLVPMPGSSFPAIHLTVATAFYGFILFYINNKYSLLANTPRNFLLVILILSGFAAIYLSDHWFTDVLAAYLAGSIVCLIHCLIYRKFHFGELKVKPSFTMIFLLLSTILCATSLSTYLNFNEISYNHTPYQKKFSIHATTWWNQQKPILPLYRLNRIGKKISLLNIQYAGDLHDLQNSLQDKGWESHSESFFTKLAMKINGKSNTMKLPLLSQLYQNKRPQLIMTFEDPDANTILELNMWESNYNLYESNQPLWIGTIHQRNKDGSDIIDSHHNQSINPITYLLPALYNFKVRRLELPQSMLTNTSIRNLPLIVLIKKPEISN